MPKLRFAILMDENGIPSWALPILKSARSSFVAEAVCDIKARRISTAHKSDVLIDAIEVHDGEEVSFFSNEAGDCQEQLRSLALDFVLSFGGLLLPDSCAGVSRYGVWRFKFGSTFDIDKLGLDALLAGEQTQKIYLTATQSSSSSVDILREGRVKLHAHSRGFHRESVVHRIRDWITSTVVAVQLGSVGTEPRTVDASERTFKLSEYFQAHTLVVIAKLKRAALILRRQFFLQTWNVGVIAQPVQDLAENPNLDNVRWWAKPDHYDSVADPFPVEIDGRLFVLAERFNYVDQVGSISSFATDQIGMSTNQIEAVRFPFHSSYPCLYEENGSVYATFETLAAKEISIYRCEKFPYLWKRMSVVATGRAFSDPTLFKHDGRHWIFATEFDRFSEGNTSLHAWYSDTHLGGPWHAHILNPIKTDISSSRSAGSPFTKLGQLLRPAQNCSLSYGQSIVLNRIEALTPTSFREVGTGEILADERCPNGIHHIAGSKNWTVVDGRTDTFSFRVGVRKIMRQVSLRIRRAVSAPALDQTPIMKQQAFDERASLSSQSRHEGVGRDLYEFL